MADAKLTALTAASALAGADLYYISQGGVSKKATHTQMLTLVGTTYVPLGGGTMTGALTIASGTLTASAPALNITQTWNNAAVAFTGARITITKTANLASKPLAVNINGTDAFYVSDTGDAYATYFVGNIAVGDGNVRLLQDAAAQLALRNGTTAQRMHIYGTYTDSSNYERLTLSTTAGSSVNIVAETLGTGGDNIDIVLTPAGTGRVVIGNVGIYPSSGLVQVAQVDSSIYGSSLQLKAYTSEDVIFYEGSTVIGRFLAGGGLQLSERTAPSAPAANSVRIYAEDNGSGKTRLMALFATGAAQQIAIEP